MWDRRPLSADALRAALVAPHGPFAGLDVVDEIGSTNTELAAAARDGAPDRSVLVAEHQSAGRGRVARSWTAPPRSGLAVSVLLRPAGVAHAEWGWLPLLAGVALVAAIDEVARLPASLKWPNDVLLGPDGGKAAGILAEVAGDAVVLGIGLNVTVTADELPVPTATSLALQGAASTDREALLAALLRRIDALERGWVRHGGDPVASGLRAEYLSVCATVGQRVRVELGDRPALVGTAVDIDMAGRLVCDVAGRHRAVSAGDVSHVRPR